MMTSRIVFTCLLLPVAVGAALVGTGRFFLRRLGYTDITDV